MGTVSAKKQIYVAGASLLTALGVAIPALVQSCAARSESGEAKTTAVEAKKLGEDGAELAQTAKTVATERYEDVKAKLDPTAQVAVDVANTCVTRAELEAVHRRIDALPLAGRRHRMRRRRVPAAVVPPEVKQPLPPTMAAVEAKETP